MNDNGRAFWLVWNPAGRNPACRHHEHHLAVNEAERLARLHPGQQFYVLEATDMREIDDMKRVRLEREIPF